MRVRSFVVLLVIFAAVGVAVWIAQLNSDAVTVDVPGLPPLAAPLWMALGLAFLAGVFVALLYSLVVSSRDAWRQRREGRTRQQDERVARSLERGVAALLRGDAESGRRLLEAAAQQQPDQARAWLLAGDAARAAGDPHAAREMHLRARGLDPDEPAVLLALSRDAEALGELDEAIDRLRDGLDAGRPDLHGLARLRDLLVSERRWSEALDVQRRILGRLDEPARREPEERRLSGLRLARARELMARTRDPDAGEAAGRAREELRELTGGDPGFVPGWVGLAELQADAGDPEAAIHTLGTGYDHSGSLELLRRQVDALLRADRPEEAIRTLERASADLEGDRRLAVRILLGRLHHRLGLVDEARAVFDRIADETRVSPAVDYYRAQLRARAGHHQAAYELLHSSILRAGVLDDRYTCRACSAVHDAWADRCEQCGRWGTVEIDLTRDLRPLEEVQAPRV